MMQKLARMSVALAVGTLLACAGSISAVAQGSGLAGLHTQVRVGNKICFLDHYHNGSSSGRKSRKEAEAAAISDWASFTSWEYGSAWGQFGLAESKSISCSNVGGWGCQLEARPCRRR